MYEVRVNGTIIDVIPGGTQTVSYTEVLGANTVTIVAVDRGRQRIGPEQPDHGIHELGSRRLRSLTRHLRAHPPVCRPLGRRRGAAAALGDQ
jgi:hypothetical protein